MSGQLIVMIGLPGSGKTEYAKQWINHAAEGLGRKVYRVSWDELRKFFGHTGAFNRLREEEMKKASIKHVEIAITCGGYQDVIIDNTNLSDSTRNMWRGVAQRLELEYVEHEIAVDVRTAVQRDAYRAGDAQVGRAVIERMALFAGLIQFPVSYSQGKKDLVILDIDGTVANLEHRREILRTKCGHCLGTGFQPDPDYPGNDPECPKCGGTGKGKKDWYNFYKQISQDTPIAPIIDLARTLRYAGHRILVVSGRPISWGDLEIGKETVAWLRENGVRYDHIFMRNGGDSREDTIVKQEILDKLPKERIAYVLDDRDSVVKMWREAGLTCLQVAEGNF